MKIYKLIDFSPWLVYTGFKIAMQVHIGLSTSKDYIIGVKEAIAQIRARVAAEEIRLVIVLSTIEFAHPGILKTIAAAFNSVPVIGCSTLALITSRGIVKHGLLIAALQIPQEIYYNAACVKEINKKSSLAAGEELGEKLLFGFQGVRRDVAMIFSDGLIQDNSGLVSGLQQKLGRSFPLVGASASDNLAFSRTYLYVNQEMLSGASCGVLWGGKLNFGIGVKHGWKPLGKPRTVTKSSGNIIQEIDAVPAARIYEEYLAKDIAGLKKDLRHISVLYPIGIYLSEEEEYLLRNILDIKEDGSLICQGSIPQDSTIRLMIGTKESCLQATLEAAQKAKSELAGKAPVMAFVFDAASRYLLLGRLAHKELAIIKEQIGADTPLIGMYTYGEKAPLNAISYLGRSYFHNQTITILMLGQ